MAKGVEDTLTNPNEAYEEATKAFARKLLDQKRPSICGLNYGKIYDARIKLWLLHKLLSE